MNRLLPYNLSNIITLFFSYFALLNSAFVKSITTATTDQLVNTSDTSSLCYSCMAVPNSMNKSQLMDHLHTHARNFDTNRTINLPEVSANCRETQVTAQGQFLGTTKYICETGACVKVKGYFQGEAYVIRECWELLWDRPRNDKWHGCAPLSFLAETNSEICVCSVDLCNKANTIAISSLYITAALLISRFLR